MRLIIFITVILTHFIIHAQCDAIEDGILLLLNQIMEGKLDATIASKSSSSNYGETRNNYQDGDWMFDNAILDYPMINTTSGMMKGQTNKHSHAFYSVPFAQPPVGSLRY